MPIRTTVAALLLLAAGPAAAQTRTAECVDGLALVPDVGAFPCSEVDLVGYLPVRAFDTPGSPAARGNSDVWGWTDSETGTEYALVGTYNGLGFVDLSEPSAPRLVAKMPTTTPDLAPVWRDVKVYADHAFVVADAARDHGVQIFDLRRLRGMTGEAQTVEPDTVYRGVSGGVLPDEFWKPNEHKVPRSLNRDRLSQHDLRVISARSRRRFVAGSSTRSCRLRSTSK